MNKEDLIIKIEKLGFPKNEIAISFHDFFKNNNCNGSIIPDYDVNPQKLYQILRELSSSEGVSDILVRVCDLDEDWPYSDSIYISTTLSVEDIKERLSKYPPDEISKGWMYGKPTNISDSEVQDSIYTIWWD